MSGTTIKIEAGTICVRMSEDAFLNLVKWCPGCKKFRRLRHFGLRRMTQDEEFLRNQSHCDSCRGIASKVAADKKKEIYTTGAGAVDF
jgi:hypothetical protein